jgi:phosphatidylserine decarboxylase
MLPFAPEGYPFVLVPALAGIVAWFFGAPALAVVCWFVMLACVAFFRDPARRSASPPEVVLAPADGKVLSVGSAPQTMAGIPKPIPANKIAKTRSRCIARKGVRKTRMENGNLILNRPL